MDKLEVQEERPPCSFLLGVWFLMGCGLLEVLIRTIQHHTVFPILRISQEYIWMIPLALLLFSAIPVGAGWVLTRVWKQVNWGYAVNLFCLGLGFFSLLLMVPGLHHYAAVVLAGGLAVQSMRIVRTHEENVQKIARTMLPWMVGVVLLAGVGVEGWQWVHQQQAYASIPQSEPESPNVLLITLDTVRAQNLSVYGYQRATTPHLEKFASRGVVFERAVSTASWTLTSHASILTGRYPHEISADWMVPLDSTYPTLAEVFQKRGYLTAGFVANTGYCSYETGLQRGFLQYQDYRVTLGQLVANSTLARTVFDNFRLRRLVGTDEHLNRQSADLINQDVLQWLEENSGKPFFLFLNYYDAHEPYLPPPPFDKKFGNGRKVGKLSPLHRWNWDPSEGHGNMGVEEIKEEINAYDGALAYLDDRLGKLFHHLESRGLMENTLVIITADHGEEFGEHEVFDHGNSLYFPSVHVPLLVSFPRKIPAGVRISQFVSLREIPVTIMDMLDLEKSSRFPGKPLARYWTREVPHESQDQTEILAEINYAHGHPEWFPVSKGDMKSLVYQGYRYILNGDGVEELYQILEDPGETQDLSANPEMQQTLQVMQARLKARLNSS